MLGSELRRLAHRDPALGPIFREILTLSEVDNWPEPGLDPPSAYIINTAARKEGEGEHWVALYVAGDRSCAYFDSYGTPPLEKIYQWLNARSLKPIHYSMKWLQSPTSRACGAYCLYFLRARARGMSFKQITDHFREGDFAWNESLVAGQSGGY